MISQEFLGRERLLPGRGRLCAPLAAALWLVFSVVPAAAAQKPERKHKLPPPQALESGVVLERDPATGELRARQADARGAEPTIRAQVTMVEAGATVVAPDGTRVRGLSREDFRLWEDNVEQDIAAFDAAATPASIALVVDASPSIFRELSGVREAARTLSQFLRPQDQVAVVAFAGETDLLLPFSPDRGLLDAALGSRQLEHVANSSQSFIYQAVFLTARQLFAGRPGRKAIVLLTDGQDSGLGLRWDPASMHARPGPHTSLAFDDVARELAAQGIELYVISTETRPRAMTEEWLEEHERAPLVTAEAQKLGVPSYTMYLAEMVRQVGGGVYFLRELGSLAEIYRRIALALGAEYTLGYYPSAGTARTGWRELRVELRASATRAPAGAQVRHRASYYVRAEP